MRHLAEQATDFSSIKYTASDQSLVWLIAESCLTFPGSDSPRNPRLDVSQQEPSIQVTMQATSP